MNDRRIARVVIVGGGTAGWLAGAALAKLLAGVVEVHLIESDEIGIVGVGEATIPQIRTYNGALGIDEDEFIRATQGTFKLGIEFINWRKPGHNYFHTFGDNGVPLGRTPFHHYWLRARRDPGFADLWAYSANAQAALKRKFTRAAFEIGSRTGVVAHAFHFDAALYAKYLRGWSEARGVKRTEGKIVGVEQNAETGFVESVRLERGEVIGGDLFIDCSGFRGLLIEGALKTGYQDWSHWLPVNRAWAVPTANAGPARPYTQSIAHQAGWQWRIPLQHRTGNGHVFCSDHISEDEARAVLLANLEGEVLAEPRLIKFVTGRRKKFWNKNVVALGLASGFLEPLESTSIHLIQSGVSRLLALFPHTGIHQAEVDEYNRQCGLEFERIRDFIILHYHATERADSPFWTHCRTMSIPEELTRKMALFAVNGVIYREQEDLFTEASWLQVMLGQGVDPVGYHPMADQLSEADLHRFLSDLRTVIDRAVDAMPTHEAYIAANCAARQD
ncbi:MAG: tryptophan 7-halogenase [Hyphomonadaceae bacterium]|nr:tryptophan 7-halogenase [Hyphomonadaceae bacterium]